MRLASPQQAALACAQLSDAKNWRSGLQVRLSRRPLLPERDATSSEDEERSREGEARGGGDGSADADETSAAETGGSAGKQKKPKKKKKAKKAKRASNGASEGSSPYGEAEPGAGAQGGSEAPTPSEPDEPESLRGSDGQGSTSAIGQEQYGLVVRLSATFGKVRLLGPSVCDEGAAREAQRAALEASAAGGRAVGRRKKRGKKGAAGEGRELQFRFSEVDTAALLALAQESGLAARDGGAKFGPMRLRANDLVHCTLVQDPEGCPGDLEAGMLRAVALAPRTGSAAAGGRRWGGEEADAARRRAFNYGPSAGEGVALGGGGGGGGGESGGAPHGSAGPAHPDAAAAYAAAAEAALGPRRGGTLHSSVVRSVAAARDEAARARALGVGAGDRSQVFFKEARGPPVGASSSAVSFGFERRRTGAPAPAALALQQARDAARIPASETES